jgi:hypothetical protein
MRNRPNASFPNNSVSSDVSGSWMFFWYEGTPFATDGNPSCRKWSCMGGYSIEGVGIMGYGNMNGCLGSISLALFKDLTMVSYDRHPHPHLVICLNFGISRMEVEP